MNKFLPKFRCGARMAASAKVRTVGSFLVMLCASLLAPPAVAQVNCLNEVGDQSANVDLIGLSWLLRPEGDRPNRIFVSLTAIDQPLGLVGQLLGLLGDIGGQVVSTLLYQNTQIWTIPADQDAEQVVATLNANEQVSYAEVDRYRNSHSTPNDALRCSQWYVENIAESYYGFEAIQGADLRLKEAWDITTGSEQVIIAVIDNGVDLSHPDIANNLWVNTVEIPDNGIDDDLNGYIDDIHGWDFNRVDNDPSPESSGRNHGTAVAGAFGAVGNNAEGIAGANWNVSIMVLKTDYSVSATVKAMEYAADMGAKIVNTSFGGSQFSRVEYETVKALQDRDVLIVASAGNEHWDNDFGPNYPGSYDLPNILTVAATSTKDDFTAWTQYGQVSVDVAAPGDTIITTEANGSGGDDSYAVRSGTSFSSPLVAGVAGLIRSQYPAATFAEVKARILASVDPIANAQCAVGSGGRVNALAALEISKQPVPVLTGIEWVDGGNSMPDPGELAVVKLSFESLWGDAGEISVGITSGDPAVDLLNDEIVLPSLVGGEPFVIEVEVRSSLTLSGHNRVPLTVSFNGPGFTAERVVCLVASVLSEGQPVEAVLQRSQLDDVQRFHIEVPEGAPSLALTLNADRNVDLYARYGNWPMRDEVLRTGASYTRGETTYMSTHDDGEELLDITDPKPGTWHVMVVNAGQLSDTGYTLNNSFGRAVNSVDTSEGQAPVEGDVDANTGSGTDSGTPSTENASQLPAAKVDSGSGGGGAAGWVLLLLMSVRLLWGKPPRG